MKAEAPRVDFYVTGESDDRARLELACRIAEKAFLKENRVFVRAPDPAQARAFDDLLWTFNDRSFVPHELAGQDGGGEAPVLIGGEAPSDGRWDLLLNLGPDVPPAYAAFPRVAEIIDGNAERRREGRERFRQYRDRGIAPDTHNLDDRG
jgi:DNA polymerase III subunit chi